MGDEKRPVSGAVVLAAVILALGLMFFVSFYCSMQVIRAGLMP